MEYISSPETETGYATALKFQAGIETFVLNILKQKMSRLKNKETLYERKEGTSSGIVNYLASIASYEPNHQLLNIIYSDFQANEKSFTFV